MIDRTVRLPAALRCVTRWGAAAMLAALLAACGGGGGGSNTVQPTISAQPNDVSVVEGTAATMTVTASGTAPLAYQWSSSVDGVTFTALAAATSSSYGTGATTLSQNGTRYRVVVSNSAGGITSSSVRLTVTAAPVAPAITVQPANVTVTAPMTATFNVTATGTTPSYQWQLSTDGGVNFTAVPGATDAPTLAITNTTTAQNTQRFRVRVSNSVGSVTSAAAVLTVNPTPMAPTITTQPMAQTIVAGGAASFTVAAAGTPAPAIQWRINGTNLVNGTQAGGVCVGTTVAGASAATLALTAVPATCTGALFSAVASNGVLPNATSNNAALTVNVPMPPVITVQPANQSVITDATATFSVMATGPALTYQWKKNGANITGATAAMYSTPAVTFVDNGALYTVVVTNADGTVTSSAAALSLSLSANQQAFESVIRSAGGSNFLRWNLNLSGAQVSGTNYAYSEAALMPLSPLTQGPQTGTQGVAENLTATLSVVLPTPSRVLKNGVILVVPNAAIRSTTTYVGADVRVDTLASDNVTVAFSQVRSNYSVVPLAGTIAATPSDFAHYYNSIFSNPAVLTSAASYQVGAGYLKYTATNLGDRYGVFDCGSLTTGATPTPCASATTLTAALTAGLTVSGVTYLLANGTMSTLGGVPVWVATVPISQATTLTVTPQYRFFFQLNGNVYNGTLARDGVIVGGSYWVSNPAGATVIDRLTFLPFDIRMNRGARDSIAAAMQI